MSSAELPAEIAKRRTFAIIAHPDAGKTTLTEKLLLFGGAIQLAGAVKARGDRRRARSDWMKVERERGISVTTSVMTFDYSNCTFNLLDTGIALGMVHTGFGIGTIIGMIYPVLTLYLLNTTFKDDLVN